VVSTTGLIFGVDPHTGYQPLLAGKGKKAAVIYASGVWGPALAPEFGSNFQSPYLVDWLRWTGITDIVEVGFHPTLTGDLDDARLTADADARAPPRHSDLPPPLFDLQRAMERWRSNTSR